MSTKKSFFHGPDGLKYFFIISLCLHGALLWSVLVMSQKGGWLARKRVDVKKPEYLQVVELPPGYKVPNKGLKPPKKAVRYADKTNVVEKENIPGGMALLVRPLPAAPLGKKTPATKAAKAAKKSVGVAKPRRVYKTKQGLAKGKGMKKAAITPKKSAHSLTPLKPSINEAKLTAPKPLPITDGDFILSNKKKKAGKSGETHGKTAAKRPLSPAKGTGHDKGGGGDTMNPDVGEKESAASAPSARQLPNLLLSDSKVSELTRRYQGSGPSSKSKTLMLNTSELKYQRYLIDLQHKIEQYWEYPRTAAIRGWEGKLFIDMTIKRDGTLSYIKLNRSSRYPLLDDAAITAIKLAAPFSSFPEDFEIDELKIHGQFVYTLIGMPRY